MPTDAVTTPERNKMVFGFCRSGWDSDAIEDSLQNALLQFYDRLPEDERLRLLGEPQARKAWFMKTIYHLLIDGRRNKRKEELYGLAPSAPPITKALKKRLQRILIASRRWVC